MYCARQILDACDTAYARDAAARPRNLRAARRAGGGGRRARGARRRLRARGGAGDRGAPLARRAQGPSDRLPARGRHLAGGRDSDGGCRGGAAAAVARARRGACGRRRHRTVRDLRGAAAHRRRRARHARRHRQAGAAAPSRSGVADAARRARSRLQLLLRRGRRRHVLRRKIVHAHEGQTRGAKRITRSRRARRRSRNFGRVAASRWVQPAPEDPRRAARRISRRAGATYVWSDGVSSISWRRAGASSACARASGRELVGDAVVLAVGHSARAVYEMLHRRGVALEAKPFAVGARVEHPQPLIDRIQYGRRLRPSAAAGGLLSSDGDGADVRRGRSRRLQLLHVPGRLGRRLLDGGGRACASTA